MNIEFLRKDFLNRAGFSNKSQVRAMTPSGSDRLFYRVIEGDRSAIIMAGKGHGAALEDWLLVQQFLHELGFSVPEIYAYDLQIPALIIEDFGVMKPPQLQQYPIVVEELAGLNIIAGENIDRCPLLKNRKFDFEALRWESIYFSEQYLQGYRQVQSGQIEKLNPLLDNLAKELEKLPSGFCHRDFQSSNIAISGSKLRIIDFQSAKYGLLEYDLASLLWDSRMSIGDGLRDELISIYIESARKKSFRIDETQFKKNLQLAAISRSMQSLGAYCYLSFVKDKKQFLDLIPSTEKELKRLLNKTEFSDILIDLLR